MPAHAWDSNGAPHDLTKAANRLTNNTRYVLHSCRETSAAVPVELRRAGIDGNVFGSRVDRTCGISYGAGRFQS